jgi:large subunit ribosomal protein L22
MSPDENPAEPKQSKSAGKAKAAEEAAEAKALAAEVTEHEQTAEEKPAARKAAAKKAPAKKAAAAEGEPKAARKPAAKKASARKAAKEDVSAEATSSSEEPKEGRNVPEKQRRRVKPAAEPLAAPGSGEEAKEAAKAKPATRPRGAAASAKGAPRRRVVRAKARYVRTSARKARMVCGHLRGKSVQEARAILAFTPREVARDWSKLLESAVANAESNHELLGDELIVREAYADEGPTIKRFRPRAMGRATPIRKRTSHLTITLTPAPENGSGRRKG